MNVQAKPRTVHKKPAGGGNLRLALEGVTLVEKGENGMIQVVAVSALVSWLVATVTAKLCFRKIDRYVRDTTNALKESGSALATLGGKANGAEHLTNGVKNASPFAKSKALPSCLEQ